MRLGLLVSVLGLIALVAVAAGVAFSPRSASAANVTGIATGGHHTCALVEVPEAAESYGVKCWGDNSDGQLGDGTNADRLRPANTCLPGTTTQCSNIVTVLTGVTAIAAGGVPDEGEGGHTCALTTSGGVLCWGLNDSGQLGDGTNTSRNRPVPVQGLSSGVVEIALGAYHSCATTEDGGVKCWGRNDRGQLGDGTTDDSNAPVDVCADEECAALLSGVALPGETSPPALDVGRLHSCVLMSDAGLKCWGDNSFGQLGDGHACGMTCSAPTDVMELPGDVITLATGGWHTCARVVGDELTCWGRNTHGQLAATRPSLPTILPQPVCAESSCDETLTSVLRVNAGDQHTCILTTTDQPQCWGLNDEGQIGKGTTDSWSRPRDVCDGPGCAGVLSGVDVISAGGAHTCALSAGGVVRCWGLNRDGQLGVGTTDDSVVPLEVPDAKAGIPPAMTPTPTPTPPPPDIGDVNCSEDVTSIDALLVLQVNAGLLAVLDCPDNADINGDGNVDSLDAALILQFVAGFLDDLPP